MSKESPISPPPRQPPATTRTPRTHLTYELDEVSCKTNLNCRRSLCEYKTTMWSALGKNELPKQKRNARVFERWKHKTKNCAPYKRQKIVSNTIITFCPVNFDNNNLRKQTNVHLLWGQASIIVDEKGSTKVYFNKFARRQFRHCETLNKLETLKV